MCKATKLNILVFSIIFIFISDIFLIQQGLKAQTYKLITYNIRYDNSADTVNNWTDRKTGLADLLTGLDPAIVGIQEGLYHQIKFLDSCLVKYEYFGVGRDDGGQIGEFCALFFDTTRLSVTNAGTFWLSQTPDQVSKGWDAALERICTYGLFEDVESGRKFWVFNTHFDHKGSQARISSARLILAKINELNSLGLPLVLMGDFNARPHEEPVKVLTSQLKDGLKLSEKPLSGPAGTYNGFSENEIGHRIDYFFLRGFRVLSYAHMDARRPNNKHLSDHFPVVIKLELQ